MTVTNPYPEPVSQYAPDQNTDHEVFGTVLNGVADMEVFVDGPFDTAGNPDPASGLYCDNDGETYVAHRVAD